MSIKYRTSAGTSASNFSDLVVKVGDTLPIGTEVDYDGQTVPAGWQEVEETNLGDVVVDSIKTKNLFDYRTSVNGAIPESSTSETLDYNVNSLTSAWIPCKPNTTYTISGSGNRLRWQTKASNGTITFVGGQSTFTTNSSAKYMRAYYWYDNSATAVPSTVTDIQIEEGETATTFSPYQRLETNEFVGYSNYHLSTTYCGGNPGYTAVYKSSTLCNANFNFQITTAPGKDITLATGLPLAKYRTTFIGMVGTTPVRFYITTNGELCTDSNNFVTGWVSANITYVIA